jgi:hypothetical protein
LGTAKVITQIYYENLHHNGASFLTAGVKNFTLWGSNEATAFAELTYGTDTNWTQLTTAASSFDEHSASNAPDPKTIAVTNTTAYRYYALKFADNWGDASYMGFRRLILKEDDVSYPADFPSAFSDDYVKATSKYDTNYWPYYAANDYLSIVNSITGASWVSGSCSGTNQRFHIDLGAGKVIKRIYYENLQHNGSTWITAGAKTFTFWGSNEASAFAELTYGTDTNWTQLTTSQGTFDEHDASNNQNFKNIDVTNSTSYRYYAIKISDNWGDPNYIGLRRVILKEAVSTDIDVDCATKSLSLTTYDAKANLNVNVGVGAGSLSVTENVAFVEYPTIVSSLCKTLTLTELSALISADISLTTVLKTLTLTTIAADINVKSEVHVDVKSLTLTPLNATVRFDTKLNASCTNLTLTGRKANINAAIHITTDVVVLDIRARYSYITVGSSIPVLYGDWRDYKGEGPWAFTEQSNKWGYLNNPRWYQTPQNSINYTGVETTEPQIWTPPGNEVPGYKYSSNGSIDHLPCGHWHKRLVGEVGILGQIYVLDTYNFKVKVFDLQGNSSFIFAEGGSGNGQLNYPRGIDVYNPSREVFVTDYDNYRVQVFTLGGVYKRQWGSYGVGDGLFVHPWGVKVYNNEVFVTDWGTGYVQVFELDGTFKRKWSVTSPLWGSVLYPYGLTVYNGEVYITGTFSVQVFSPIGTALRSWGPTGGGDGQLSNAYGIDIYNDEIFVADNNSSRIQVFSKSGTYDRKWSYLNMPSDVVVYGGEIYVADTNGLQVQVFTLTGSRKRKWTANFNYPYGIAVSTEVVTAGSI